MSPDYAYALGAEFGAMLALMEIGHLCGQHEIERCVHAVNLRAISDAASARGWDISHCSSFDGWVYIRLTRSSPQSTQPAAGAHLRVVK